MSQLSDSSIQPMVDEVVTKVTKVMEKIRGRGDRKASVTGKRMKIDKESANFLLSGGSSEHIMTNTTNERIAVKIRCSNNKLFRVTPVYVVIEAGMSQKLFVSRSEGAAKPDKLIVQNIPCTDDVEEAKEAFRNNFEEEMIEALKIKLKVTEPSRESGKMPELTEEKAATVC